MSHAAQMEAPPARGRDSSSPPALNVLVVDDELNIRKALSACLEADGHKVVAIGTAAEAIEVAGRKSFDLAFVDLFLGKESGLDLIPRLTRSSSWMKVVVITAYASVESAVGSMKLGALDFLSKPFTPAQVAALTDRVSRLRGLEQQVSKLGKSAAPGQAARDLTSSSSAMQRTLELARKVAAGSVSVLIRGERGSGKGILARAIHAWGPRAQRPFTIVSCPSLAPQLLETEIFGDSQNPGQIAASEGGTLFLDEVAELPISLQPRLLRLLQDRQYERVGERASRSADVRVIAATSLDLEKAVAAATFREDLLYRLNVVQLAVPPLRERPEDILEIANQLLLQFAARNHSPARSFSTDAQRLLVRYRWPGNVRELHNAVERAVLLCNTDTVLPEHLLLESTPDTKPLPAIGDPVPIDVIEELHIRAVLSTAKSIEQASQILGMDTVTLWRRRKRYGI